MKPGLQPITADAAREMFDYFPDTGHFIRRGTGRFAGKRAGCLHRSSGYWVIKINSKQILAHRLAWLWMHGEWPEDFIDHRDRSKTDNRVSELRKATNGQNIANSKPRARSGFKGVYAAPRMPGRWQAQINVNGKTTNIGTFDNIEEAARAYREAATKQYGAFARFE